MEFYQFGDQFAIWFHKEALEWWGGYLTDFEDGSNRGFIRAVVTTAITCPETVDWVSFNAGKWISSDTLSCTCHTNEIEDNHHSTQSFRSVAATKSSPLQNSDQSPLAPKKSHCCEEVILSGGQYADGEYVRHIINDKLVFVYINQYAIWHDLNAQYWIVGLLSDFKDGTFRGFHLADETETVCPENLEWMEYENGNWVMNKKLVLTCKLIPSLETSTR